MPKTQSHWSQCPYQRYFARSLGEEVPNNWQELSSNYETPKPYGSSFIKRNTYDRCNPDSKNSLPLDQQPLQRRIMKNETDSTPTISNIELKSQCDDTNINEGKSTSLPMTTNHSTNLIVAGTTVNLQRSSSAVKMSRICKKFKNSSDKFLWEFLNSSESDSESDGLDLDHTDSDSDYDNLDSSITRRTSVSTYSYIVDSSLLLNCADDCKLETAITNKVPTNKFNTNLTDAPPLAPILNTRSNKPRAKLPRLSVETTSDIYNLPNTRPTVQQKVPSIYTSINIPQTQKVTKHENSETTKSTIWPRDSLYNRTARFNF